MLATDWVKMDNHLHLKTNMSKLISVESINNAAKRLEGVVKKTPLQFNKRLSKLFEANIYIKREDLQEVRSYKIRGAYNLMSSLSVEERKRGVVSASAGNHAQGVAFAASSLKIKAIIFMPVITPLQKINKVKQFGGRWVEIKLVGQTFDESSQESKKLSKEKNMAYVHPFDDLRTIIGQGTVGKEISEQLEKGADILIAPVGGGGLISGVGTYMRSTYPKIEIIGVEPKGAPSMYESINKGKVVTLDKINTFVDGAAVKTVGQKTFEISKEFIKKIILVDEGNVCTTMIELYQNEGIIAEPAGALTIAALDQLKEKIKNKTVVCILSGGNNDILRYPEIMEKSLVYQGLKHYFLVEFAQKPGQLKNFLNYCLGPSDDIVLFEYTKKNSRERGPALIGIELSKKEDLMALLKNMNKYEIKFTKINSDDPLYSFVL